MDNRQSTGPGGESNGAWVIDEATCTRCGICVRACPEAVVALEGGRLVLARPEACTYCAVCEEICPVGAIALAYAIVWDEASTESHGDR